MKTKFFNILAYLASSIVCISAVVWLGYYYPWYLAVGTLTALLSTSLFFLWRFSNIIMVLENDLGQATQALEEVAESMQQIIEMKLYFDTPEVQQLVSHVMDSVRMAQFSVNKMIGNFTDRSKQKFIMTIEEEPDDMLLLQQQQPQKEGTIASVGRSTTNYNQQQR